MRRAVAYMGAMNRDSSAMGETPSPCIGICQMDPVSRLCDGCRRTIDEIATWSLMSVPDKRRLLADLARRRR